MNCLQLDGWLEQGWARAREPAQATGHGLFGRLIDGVPSHGEWLVACGWQLLNGCPAAQLADELRRAGLQRMADGGCVYSETETQFWLRVVQRVLHLKAAEGWSEVRDALLSYADRRDLPLQYYSRERWYSQLARYRWLRPDRRNFIGERLP
ncbi:MAG: hypothetical protein R3270_04395 [Gammaproteobacteria bacterium]|nr:hypothetical protein [Gammaproteobacteria bacterium]